MSPDQDVQKEIEQLEQRFAENAQGLVFAHLADAYRRAGEFAKAEGLLLHGLKTHATYTSAYNVLGRVYLDSERLADAHQQFSKVLELDPQNLIALRALGDLAARGGRVEDARSWYERMLHIDPRSDEAREGLSKLETQGEPEEPVAAEASAIAESPDADAPAEASALETLDAEVSGEAALAAEPPSEAGVAAGEGQETWDIEALLADDTSSSAESGVEAVEGLIDSEVGLTDLQGRSSEMEPELGEPAIDAGAAADEAPPPPPPTEATSDLESAFATDSFSLDDLDLGIIDDWTPGMARSADEVSSERTGDVVADSIFEGLSGTFPFDVGAEAPVTEESDEGWEADEPEEPAELVEGVVTETMAELYAGQGLFEDALKVYRQLAEVRPHDERLRSRIGELEQQLTEARSTAEADEEELAELLELTQPSAAETWAEEVSEVAEVEEPAAAALPEGDFEFADEAPIAGIEQLDPFASSFDVMALDKPSPQPVARAAIEIEAEAVEEDVAVEVAPEAEIVPVAELEAEPEAEAVPVTELEFEAAVDRGPEAVLAEAETIEVEISEEEPAELLTAETEAVEPEPAAFEALAVDEVEVSEAEIAAVAELMAPEVSVPDSEPEFEPELDVALEPESAYEPDFSAERAVEADAEVFGEAEVVEEAEVVADEDFDADAEVVVDAEVVAEAEAVFDWEVEAAAEEEPARPVEAEPIEFEAEALAESEPDEAAEIEPTAFDAELVPDVWESAGEITVDEPTETVAEEVPADFTASEWVADFAPPEPPAVSEEIAEPGETPATIEQYLTRILSFAPEAAEIEESPVDSAPEPSSASDEGGSDDLEQFQEWLRSLKR